MNPDENVPVIPATNATQPLGRWQRLAKWCHANMTGISEFFQKLLSPWLWVPRVLLQLMEFLTVLGMFSIITYSAVWLIRGGLDDPHRIRVIDLLKTLNENWKALGILIALLFYRSVRTVIANIRKVGGMHIGDLPNSASPGENISREPDAS